jgi:hypothetical protein
MTAKLSQEDDDQNPPSRRVGVPLESGGEVTVTFLKSPPTAGPKSIHPRRQAPIIPEREDEAGG